MSERHWSILLGQGGGHQICKEKKQLASRDISNMNDLELVINSRYLIEKVGRVIWRLVPKFPSES